MTGTSRKVLIQTDAKQASKHVLGWLTQRPGEDAEPAPGKSPYLKTAQRNEGARGKAQPAAVHGGGC